MTIALMGGHDYARAKANKATDTRLRDIKKEWVRLCDHFGGNGSPDAVTYEAVVEYINKRRDKGIRGQSIIRDIQALKRGCAIAEAMGAFPFPPKLWPTVGGDPKKKSQQGKLHPTNILRAWFDQLEGETYDEARFIVLTGLRDEECSRAQVNWVEHVDEVGSFLHVPDWASKDRDERFVYLSAEALEIYGRYAHDKDGRKRTGDATLFSGADHKKARKGACKAIGYPTTITLRDLRATWSTIAVQRTGDAAAVQASMGHEDLSTTQMYQKSTLSRQAHAGRAVAREIGASRHSKADTENGEAVKRSQEWELNPRPADYESAPGFLALASGWIYSVTAARRRTDLRIVVDDSCHSERTQQKKRGSS